MIIVLEIEYKRAGSPLREYLHDPEGIPCEVLVPASIRNRVVAGARIEGIQLLPPQRNNRVLANIMVKGAEDVANPIPKMAKALGNDPLHWGKAGGFGGVEPPRLPSLARLKWHHQGHVQ